MILGRCEITIWQAGIPSDWSCAITQTTPRHCPSITDRTIPYNDGVVTMTKLKLIVLLTVSAVLTSACASTVVSRPSIRVLSASHEQAPARVGFHETETEWIIEGEARGGGDFTLTVSEAEGDALAVLSSTFGAWVRNALFTLNQGSNVPGEYVDRLVERGQLVFSQNKVFAKRSKVYWEYVSEEVPGQLPRLFYNVRVQLTISAEDRMRATRETLQQLAAESTQERNEQLHQDILRLLQEAESMVPPSGLKF